MVRFVLPAYNEGKNLLPLIEKIHLSMTSAGLQYEVLAVDDGSTDETGKVLKECGEKYPLRVIVHQTNLGLPRTIEDGLSAAVRGAAPSDAIIAMDADNTHEPELAVEMVRRLNEGFDIVIASRYKQGGEEIGLPLARSVLSRGINLMLAFLLPIPRVSDYTCGYRAYRPKVLQDVFAAYGDKLIESTTFTATAEILIKARAVGVRATEVPLVLRYDQKTGRSKMKVAATIVDYLNLIAREKLRSSSSSRRSPRRLPAKAHLIRETPPRSETSQ